MSFFETVAGQIVLWLGGSFLLLNLLILVFFYPLIGYILYIAHLKKTSKKLWSRECSSKDPVMLSMFNEGLAWREAHKDCLTELHIKNEGLNLYAEFADLGYDRTVMMVSGRTEGMYYGYYFAPSYAAIGYNVMVIDQRAHGKSDGKYNTLGFEEHKDLLAWARLLHDEHRQQSIIFHGICIGSANSLYALLHKDCPDYILGMTAEGMFPAFRESFANHMIEMHRKPEPMLRFVDFWMRFLTGHSMSVGPIHRIGELKKPILMLHSKEDAYSLPNRAEDLYALCSSERKHLEWFEHGAHSMLRITDTPHYDSAIADFWK